MSDQISDPTLLSLETAVDTQKSEEGFAALLQKMQQQSSETTGFIKELGDAIKDLVGAVVEKGEIAEKAAEKATQSAQKQTMTIQEELGKLKSETQKQLHAMEELYEEHGIKTAGSLEQAAKTYEAAIKKVKENAVKGILSGPEAKQMLEELEHDAKSIYEKLEEQKKQGLGGLFKEKTEGFGGKFNVKDNLLGAAEEGISGIMKMIPPEIQTMGLIGLLMYGAGEAEERRSAAVSTLQTFRDNVGQSASDIVGSVTEVGTALEITSQSLRVNSKELDGVYQTLGKAGLSAREAGLSYNQLNESFKDGELTTSGLQNNLGVLTVAIDKAYNLQTGQSAKEAVSLSRELGMSVQHAAESMAKLRAEAQGSGDDIERYMGAVLGASKAMSQYGIDIGTTTTLMNDFRSKDPTGGAQAAQAIQGVGSAMQNIASNAGLAAFMGENIVKREGHLGDYKPGSGPVDALEARRQLLLGFGKEGPEGGKVLGDILGEMQHVARQSGQRPAEQEYAIEKLFGVNTVTAHMINSLNKGQIDDIRAGKGTGGLSTDDMEKLKGGFKTEEERRNQFQDAVKHLLEGIKDILQGIFEGVYAGTSAIIAMAHLDFSGKTEWGKQAVQHGTAAGNFLAKGFSEMGEAASAAGRGLAGAPAGPTYGPSEGGAGGREKRDMDMYSHSKAMPKPMPHALAPMPYGPGMNGSGSPDSSSTGGGGNHTADGSYDQSTGGIIFRIPPEALTSVQRNRAGRQGTR